LNNYIEEIRKLDNEEMTIEQFYYTIFKEMTYIEFFRLKASFKIYREGNGQKYNWDNFLSIKE